MQKAIFLAFLCCLSMLFCNQRAQAQDADPLTLQVTQLAGQNVYLNGGIDQGIAIGDTLVVSRAGGRALVVIGASRKQSIAQFAGAPFPLTRGQELTVRLVKAAPGDIVLDETDIAAVPVEPETVSIMEEAAEPTTRTRRSRSGGLKVDGRLMIDLAALNSETRIRSSNVPAVSRTYFTPAINLNATVSNLPSDMRLNVHIRTDYRYQSRGSFGPDNSFRAYQINVEKSLPFGAVQVGRFYNRMMQRGGYWDGLSFMVGSKKKGIGGSVGFMPDRSNEGFTTQFPRFALFAHYQTPRSSEVSYKGAVSYNQIQPNTLFLNHRYAALEQRVDWSFLSLRQDLQVDHDPLSNQWVVSHLRLSGRFALGRYVSAYGSYTLRKPFKFYNTLDPFLSRRDQYRVGISANTSMVSFGGSYSTRFFNNIYQGRTYNAYFNTRPLSRLGLSFSGSGSYWESDIGTAIYANGGIAKNFNKLYVRADYGFYRSESPNVTAPIDMHRVSLSTSLPFGRSMYWRMRAGYQQSQFTNSISVQTGLQLRF